MNFLLYLTRKREYRRISAAACISIVNIYYKQFLKMLFAVLANSLKTHLIFLECVDHLYFESFTLFHQESTDLSVHSFAFNLLLKLEYRSPDNNNYFVCRCELIQKSNKVYLNDEKNSVSPSRSSL